MRLVIFDMDGTLVDSSGLMVESAEAACRRAGIEPPEPAVIRSVSGLNLETGLRRLAPDADEHLIAILAAGYREAYLSSVQKEMREPMFPGILDVLVQLDARTETLMAVATGKASKGAERVLATHGIRHYFECVQTPDTNRSKPDPEMVHSAMNSVGVDARDTVMVGDTNHDMEMAAAAGVKAIGVSWGYHPTEDLMAAGADMVIDRQSELIAAIDALLGSEYA